MRPSNRANGNQCTAEGAISGSLWVFNGRNEMNPNMENLQAHWVYFLGTWPQHETREYLELARIKVEACTWVRFVRLRPRRSFSSLLRVMQGQVSDLGFKHSCKMLFRFMIVTRQGRCIELYSAIVPWNPFLPIFSLHFTTTCWIFASHFDRKTCSNDHSNIL